MKSYHIKKTNPNILNKIRPNIDISNLHLFKLNNFKTNEYIEEKFLCFNGYYKVVNDKLIKIKIIDDEYVDNLNNVNFLNDDTILINNKSISLLTSKEILENCGEFFQLPPEHEKILITKKNYKTNKKSKHKLVVEIFNKTIIDLYFLSEERISNHSLEEDIISLLSTLI